MCGRFGVFSPPEELAVRFGLADPPDVEPNYNIPPGTDILIVRPGGDGKSREAALVHWGLIPFWAEDASVGNRMINARAETFHKKNAFKKAAQRRRCLIPADGFYEWTAAKDGGKRPYFIRRNDEEPFGMAGIWERWTNPDEEVVESAAILTTNANSLAARLHDRMPVIIPDDQFSRWLDPETTDPSGLEDLLTPLPADRMQAHPVSTAVNNPQKDGPEMIEPQREEQLDLLS